MFEIIYGNQQKKEQKLKEKREFLYKKHKELYEEYLYGFTYDIDDIKAIYHGVNYIKLINIDNLDYRQILKVLCDIQDINCLLSKITYKDFINLFPIEKEYDGKKFECKDYFSTLDFLENKDLDNIIGEDIYEVFFNYYNNLIINYSIKEMLLIDRKNRFEGGKSLMESFLDEFDKEHKIDTYIIHEKEGYTYNKNTGKTKPIKKPKKRKPSYINIVK